MVYFFWLFMCDTLCIHVYFHALNYIRVIVILTCDCDTYVTCVLSTLIYICVMSLGYAHLPCFHVLL